ncbi:MAG: serine/threonine-protein kinase [Planctomycetota bacterium]
MSEAEASEAERRESERLYVRIALKNGLVDEDQVAEAISVQDKIRELGVSPKPLHEILLEKGFVDAAANERILRHLKKVASATRIRGYTLIERLGSGSMGTVFKARQDSLDRVVAVKVLAPFLTKNERYVNRFIKEAKVLARLNHPNIVQCIDVGESEGHYYMAMEYCDGPTVLDVIHRGGRMAPERALNIILQVARALEHAFEHEIIHRDVKPDNVMIIAGGTAKLCDLGLVKDLGSGGASTDQGSAMGTPNYIAPEQARGDETVDARADIYSLGASWYHMITGRPPFEHANPASVMVAHINDMPIAPKDRCPDLDNETSRIVMKMLRKNPDDRYQTPSALIRDLHKLAARYGGAVPDAVDVPIVRSRKRRRR